MTNDGTNTYTYDAEGRVCSVTNPVSFRTTVYLYDSEGRRVGSGGNGAPAPGASTFSCAGTTGTLGSVYVLGKSGEEVAVTGGDGTWQQSNAYANGGILATITSSSEVFPLHDWLGTRRVSTGAFAAADGSTVLCGTGYTEFPYGDGLAANPLQVSTCSRIL